jgi:hypothetical protein
VIQFIGICIVYESVDVGMQTKSGTHQSQRFTKNQPSNPGNSTFLQCYQVSCPALFLAINYTTENPTTQVIRLKPQNPSNPKTKPPQRSSCPERLTRLPVQIPRTLKDSQYPIHADTSAHPQIHHRHPSPDRRTSDLKDHPCASSMQP